MNNNTKYSALIIAVILSNLFVIYIFGVGFLLGLAPLSLGFIAYIIYFRIEKINLIIKSMITVLMMTIMDLSTKLFSGGTFDQVGQALTQLTCYFTIATGLAVLIIKLWLKPNNNPMLKEKVWSLITYLILAYLEVYFFDNLGPGMRVYHW